MRTKDITEVDLNRVFLHYTAEENLDSILKNGLEPRIGANSKVIEKNKKVFFSVGDKGALVIMDVWIKWLWVKPKTDAIYLMGVWLMKHKAVPKPLPRIIAVCNKNSKRKIEWCYRKMKKILDHSVYLVLDLEENVDYDMSDVDEAKAYLRVPKDFFETVYAFDSDIDDPAMEYWNMHTIPGKVINPTKISLLKSGDQYSASDIVKSLIENNLDFVKENCDKLYSYYKYFYANS